jgi:hypothetical protein
MRRHAASSDVPLRTIRCPPATSAGEGIPDRDGDAIAERATAVIQLSCANAERGAGGRAVRVARNEEDGRCFYTVDVACGTRLASVRVDLDRGQTVVTASHGAGHAAGHGRVHPDVRSPFHAWRSET